LLVGLWTYAFVTSSMHATRADLVDPARWSWTSARRSASPPVNAVVMGGIFGALVGGIGGAAALAFVALAGGVVVAGFEVRPRPRPAAPGEGPRASMHTATLVGFASAIFFGAAIGLAVGLWLGFAKGAAAGGAAAIAAGAARGVRYGGGAWLRQST
jgi:hypothetical protein